MNAKPAFTNKKKMGFEDDELNSIMHQKGLNIDKTVSRLGNNVVEIDESSVFDNSRNNNLFALK